jgi:hypothetical protein
MRRGGGHASIEARMTETWGVTGRAAGHRRPQAVCERRQSGCAWFEVERSCARSN